MANDTSPPSPSARQRLRFDSIQVETFPDGFSEATVVLEWQGDRFEGTARRASTLEGGLRAGAEATLVAVRDATGDHLTLTLRGVKAVRAFDAWVVIASVRGHGEDQPYSLLGSYACLDENTPRGAAVAVLDAVNRVVEKYVSRP